MPPPRPDLRIEALAAHHDRGAFSCSIDSLDRYLRSQAGQDVRRRANGVFILVAADAVETVLGYYTLCAASLPQLDVPAAARKHVPRYPLVSATLIGRLAVSRSRQGDGLGSLLLADAVQRAYASAETVGSSMLVVDALNERAAAFYQSFGFQPLPESLRLVLPMRSIERMLAMNGSQDERRATSVRSCDASIYTVSASVLSYSAMGALPATISG